LDAGYVGRDRNPRRTGRTTTTDFRTFSAARQCFNGTDDYQVYMVLPWRLPSYRAGYYLATASFLLTNQTVRSELMQTTDYGQSWTQLAPRAEFIPCGPPGSFDSHTIYTAWSGEASPVLDPQNEEITRFYYVGGNGPHDGQRDDSIGLAYAQTHAYAGLVASGRMGLRTAKVLVNGTRTLSILAALHGPDAFLRVAVSAGDEHPAPECGSRCETVRVPADGVARWWHVRAAAAMLAEARGGVWLSFSFEAAGATLFAIRSR
jgi:hypothetical protein